MSREAARASSERSGHSLFTRLDRFKKYADKPAYYWREGVRWRSRSFGVFRDRILSCAQLLSKAGVRSGTPVVIQGPNHPDWIEALFATFLAGGVAVPLDEVTPDEFRSEVTRKVRGTLIVAPPDIAPPPESRRIDFGSWAGRPSSSGARGEAEENPGSVAEIVFTSGTTGEPKGVVLTHGNLNSDFGVIERAFLKYEPVINALGTLRFLSTLPLSHMFGQAMNAFLAPFMGLTVVFVPPRPREILEAARRHGPWGIFTVPRVMDLMGTELRRILREEGRWEAFESRHERFQQWPFYLQALIFRRVQRLFGWRFRLLVSGGASLPGTVKQFWQGFGYLVIQGYGLTETAPVVSVSNPFDRSTNSVGRPLGIQEVKLGPEGEVWVRGPNVTPGYYGMEGAAEGEGWFRTGDVGEFDEKGRLRIRGRLKDVIVTPEGENVHPVDVESAFRGITGVRGACVIALPFQGSERVHAALLLKPDADPEECVHQANRKLQPRQRVRDYSVWPEEDFPRTSTGKVRKGIVRERVLSRSGEDAPETGSPAVNSARRLIAQVARISEDRLDEATSLAEDLGLSSLDLVELGVRFEEEFGVALPEDRVGEATVRDLERAVRESVFGTGGIDSRATLESPTGEAPEPPGAEGVPDGMGETLPKAMEPPGTAVPRHRRRGSLRIPRWTFSTPLRILRQFLEIIAYRPLIWLYARPEVSGLEHLHGAEPPFLFISNHHTHLDVGMFWAALPSSFRGRLATGMTTRYQRVYFGETDGGLLTYLREGWVANLVHLLFGTWPLPETAGFRTSLIYAGELADRGYSLLIFPEGIHTPEGTLGRFREGIGIFARDLRLPVVPVYLEGTARVLPSGAAWMRFGKTRFLVGRPIQIEPDDSPAETTRRLQEAVRRLKSSIQGTS